MPAILLLAFAVIYIILYYRERVWSYPEDKNLVYDNFFEHSYNNISNDDFDKLEELKKKAKKLIKINNIMFILFLIILFVFAVLPQTQWLRNNFNFSMAMWIISFSIFIVVYCCVIYYLRQRNKVVLKSLDNDNSKIINKFLVLTEKFGDSVNDINLIDDIKYTYISLFKKPNSIARHDYDVCERPDLRYYEEDYSFENILIDEGNYGIITSNVRKNKKTYSRHYSAVTANYELFSIVQLKENINEDVVIQINTSNMKLQINSSNTKLSSLIKQNLEEKLLKYYKNYYSFEILIKNNKMYIRVGEVVGYKYYSTRLSRKEFFYEMYKSRNFILNLANELVEVIKMM